VTSCHNCVDGLADLIMHYELDRQSDLYKNLSHGLCDTDIIQKEKGVLIADYDIDRKEKNNIGDPEDNKD